MWGRGWSGEVVKAGPPGIAAVIPARDCLDGFDGSTIATRLGLGGRRSQLAEIAASHDESIVAERGAVGDLFGRVCKGDHSGWRRRGEVVEFRDEGDGGRGILGLLSDLRRGKLLESGRTRGGDGRFGGDGGGAGSLGINGTGGSLVVQTPALFGAVERKRALVDDGAVFDGFCARLRTLGGGLDGAVGLHTAGALNQTTASASGWLAVLLCG